MCCPGFNSQQCFFHIFPSYFMMFKKIHLNIFYVPCKAWKLLSCCFTRNWLLAKSSSLLLKKGNFAVCSMYACIILWGSVRRRTHIISISVCLWIKLFFFLIKLSHLSMQISTFSWSPKTKWLPKWYSQITLMHQAITIWNMSLEENRSRSVTEEDPQGWNMRREEKNNCVSRCSNIKL